jgi:hypothetical protein
VLIADQRSPMIGRHRIATLTQHRACLLVGAITHSSGGARTGHPHHITQTTLPQLLSEQRRSHHRSSAIETAYKRDVQPRATHNPYRFLKQRGEVIGVLQIEVLRMYVARSERFELRTKYRPTTSTSFPADRGSLLKDLDDALPVNTHGSQLSGGRLRVRLIACSSDRSVRVEGCRPVD